MPRSGTFAFLVHPRTRLADDMGLLWAPLRKVPERFYDVGLRRLPIPPVVMSTVDISGQDVGRVVLVPFGARHMLSQPGEARIRVARAVDRAAQLGVHIVGLGALTAPVTAGGVALRTRTDVGVTNGNAFTAAVVDTQARQLLDSFVRTAGPRTVAVVGATGSVGSAVVGLLARDQAVDRLTLVARSTARLTRLADLTRRRVPAQASTHLSDVRGADLVIMLTSAADAVLGAQDLKADTVVLDATQPRNTSPDLVASRPDITVVDGGIVDIPGLRLRGGDIGLPDGRAYACFAETALLALSGHRGHFALGAPSLRQVDHMRALARDFGQYGFTVAAATSFGQPLQRLTPPGQATVAA